MTDQDGGEAVDTAKPAQEVKRRLKAVRKRLPPGYKKPGPKPDGPSQSEKNRKRRRSARRRAPTRMYHAPEQMKMAYLAGEGASGEEIAQIIGGTSGPKVRAVLSRFGLKMKRSAWRETVIQIICRVSIREKLEAVADARGMLLDEMVVKLLDTLDEEDIGVVLDRPPL